MARDPRPASYFNRFHQRVRRGRPSLLYPLARVGLMPILPPLFRIRIIRPDRVPTRGPLILAPTHGSFLDHFLLAYPVWGRRLTYMAKSELFQPLLNPLISTLGAFPVRRGYHDEEAFRTAHAVLDRGDAVTIYCQGGRRLDGHLGDSVRPGVGRLALESGAVVVPTVIYNSWRIREWRRLHFPQITIYFGEALQWDPEPDPSLERQLEVATEVFARIADLHREIETQGRDAIRRHQAQYKA